MTVKLILVPAFIWLLALTLGLRLIRSAPASVWKAMQPLRTTPEPYDPAQFRHRAVIVGIRAQGWFLFGVAAFVTLMVLLVAAGVVEPAA